MPESVNDRPTKAHEYLFLLSKNERYHYDQEAIKDPVTGNAHSRGDGVNPKTKNPAYWMTGAGRHNLPIGRERPRPRQNPSFSAAVSGILESGLRNKRSVWTIATQTYSEAHFATFPEKLVEPCILAGCPEGGIVFDPFVGSGTTVRVAESLNRKGIGLDLAYHDISRRRVRNVQRQLVGM